MQGPGCSTHKNRRAHPTPTSCCCVLRSLSLGANTLGRESAYSLAYIFDMSARRRCTSKTYFKGSGPSFLTPSSSRDTSVASDSGAGQTLRFHHNPSPNTPGSNMRQRVLAAIKKRKSTSEDSMQSFMRCQMFLEPMSLTSFDITYFADWC